MIGNVIIDNRDVFDTSDEEENTWFHETANSLHIKTRLAVIKNQLLFEQGDVYDQSLIDETERLLRANRYIKSVRIVPTQICDDKIELRVITTDSWTLTPGISFSRSGGVNTTTVNIEEHNVFGYGKELLFNVTNDIEGTENRLVYLDKNLFGSRNVLGAEYRDSSDGRSYGISTGLPFYQFAGEYAWNLGLSSLIQENEIYEQGILTDSLGRKNKRLDAYYAWGEQSNPLSVNRYRLGWSYRDEESFATELSPAIQLPPDTIYSSPFFGWQHAKQHFIKKINLFGAGVTEDISLGYNADVQLGWINEDWGATGNFISLKTRYSKGNQPTADQLLLWKLNIEGILGNDTSKDVIITARGDWFLFHNERSRLHILNIIQAGKYLSIDNQILLGGDSGLRGYPLKYQNGDRKFLLSIEERYFFDWYPFHLVVTGISAFVDIGSAWNSETESENTLRDVGFGFLFVSTRQSNSDILRIDFAFPLDDADTVDSFQILVGTQIDF